MKLECSCVNLKPTHGRFLFYKLLTAIPVAAAVVAMIRHSEGPAPLVGYACLCGFHVLMMYANKCPHCAYYRARGRLHRCFMMWGFPKISKPRPGPAPKFLALYVPLAILALTVYPTYWLRFEWELLLVYILGVVVVLYSILMQECPRCAYFACPANKVPPNVRAACLKRTRR